jgi:hypothetical protein
VRTIGRQPAELVVVYVHPLAIKPNVWHIALN